MFIGKQPKCPVFSGDMTPGLVVGDANFICFTGLGDGGIETYGKKKATPQIFSPKVMFGNDGFFDLLFG